MDAGLVITMVAVVIVPLAIGIPAQRRFKKLGKKARSGMGAGLSALNEVFHPAASATTIVVEERKEAMAPKPSPEDKPELGTQ